MLVDKRAQEVRDMSLDVRKFGSNPGTVSVKKEHGCSTVRRFIPKRLVGSEDCLEIMSRRRAPGLDERKSDKPCRDSQQRVAIQRERQMPHTRGRG